MKKKNRNKILVVAFLAAVIILAVIIYVIPNIVGLFEKTEVLEYGNLPVYNEVTGYIVRDEKVFLADRAGELEYYIGEGTKLRKDTKILDITGTGGDSDESEYTNILKRLGDNAETLGDNAAQFSGTVSYFIDGYENYFTPLQLKDITQEDAKKRDEKPVNLTRKKTMKGDPIYKIVDNNIWYMIFWLDSKSGDLQKFEPGKGVTVEFDEGETRGEVDSILDQENNWLIVIKFDKYYEKFAQVRKTEAKVIAADYQGLIVENKSITVENDQEGVYVKQKNGDFKFTPVNIIMTAGTKSVISVGTFTDDEGKVINTVNYYEEVLKNPKGMNK